MRKPSTSMTNTPFLPRGAGHVVVKRPHRLNTHVFECFVDDIPVIVTAPILF